MLVKWGTVLADEMGVDAYVESSRYAQHLYQQYGFHQIDSVEIPVPARFANRPKIRYTFFKRPANRSRSTRNSES